MINLAGHKNCDLAIAAELRRCGIPSVHGERSKGEVAASITGQLGPFRFTRAWYYWVAEGPIPLSVAIELYEDPAGKSDIRSGGHCGCPHPRDYGVEWRSESGKVIADMKNFEEATKWANSDSSLKECGLRVLANYEFAEDPSAVGQGFVDLYHIDSELGLLIFADAIKRHGLDRDEGKETKHATP